jgi:outer membrane protein, heavy metal efflux system
MARHPQSLVSRSTLGLFALGLAAALPSFAGTTLRLEDAVALAFERDPGLEIARAGVLARRGALEERRGAFDPRLLVNLTTDRVEQNLLSPVIELEKGKRELQRRLAAELTQTADDLEQQLADPNRLPIVRCPEGREAIVINGVDVCVRDRDRAEREAADELLRLLIEQAADPAERARFEAIRARELALLRPIATRALAILRQEAAAAAERLRLLGALPETEERYSLRLDLRLAKRLRSGLEPACGLILEGVEDNYVGKPLRGAFGGKNLPNTFTSFAGCQLEAPLAKGFGRAAAGAAEAAAEEALRAADAALEQVHAERALAVIEAYWVAAAAEARVELLGEALATQDALGSAARGLVRGQELGAYQLSRAVARRAETAQALDRARQERLAARVGLADAIGLSLRHAAEAPVPAAPLPTAPAALPAPERAELWQRARAARGDLEAARRQEEAAAVLETAARRSLQPSLDLTFAVGMNAFHQSFEQDFWEPAGLYDALGGNYAGPTGQLAIKLVLPHGNREARGQLARAEALRWQARIEARELERRIGNQLASVLGGLDPAHRESRERDTAAAAYGRSYEATARLLEVGESSLLDLALTEEQWTAARLAAIDARAELATLRARLAFESGRLVQREGEGFRLEPSLEEVP